MVSIQEKIRNLSMGIAVSSIMSTGAVHAQEQHQPDKFPQAIEKTDEWQRVTMPDMDIREGFKSDEKAEEYLREYANKNGDLFWIATRRKILTPQEQEHEIKEQVSRAGHAYKKRASLSAIIPTTSVDETLSINTNLKKQYLYLQKDDFIKISRYNATRNLAMDCIALSESQPQNVNKVLPGLSELINSQSDQIGRNQDGTYPTNEVVNMVQKHLLKNFNKIAPDFDKQMETKYNERDPNLPTLKKMTPEAFYLMNTGYMVNFDSPKIADDVQKISDIMSIEPDPITQTQQKTVDNHQESQTSTAVDKISELRGTNSISDSKKNIKNNWQQIKQNINNAKNNFNNIWRNKSSEGR